MKRSLLLVVVCVFSITASAQTRRVSRTAVSPAANTNSNIRTLPIRRVILYSNGVAYIETSRDHYRPRRDQPVVQAITG